MLACCNGLHHQAFGNAVTTNELNHNVNFGIGNDLPRITHHFDMGPHQSLRFGHIQIGHHGDFNATASTALDFFLIAAQYIEGATAHGTHA